MRLPVFWIDAFSDRVFGGNPAAVVPLARWLPEPTMRAIAAEHGLSETAFLVPEPGGWAIRWFTPKVEVDLCGHATLAAGHALFTRVAPGTDRVRFSSRSGPLHVTRNGDLLVIDLPASPAAPCETPAALSAALGRAPATTLSRAQAYLAVFDRAADVLALAPDMARLAALDLPFVMVTAPGDDCDFVSRFFAPAAGIPEDPVTGSAHTTLVPYWAQRLGRRSLHARQVSARGGELWCEDADGRVRLGGRAALYLEGFIEA